MKGTKIFLNKKKTKSANMLGKDIKNLPNKKKRKDITIIRNISKRYLSIEEVIIYLFIYYLCVALKILGQLNLFSKIRP